MVGAMKQSYSLPPGYGHEPESFPMRIESRKGLYQAPWNHA